MRSYILAIAVAMLLAAIYAFQNAAEISVSFFMFERSFPQGVWEAILFSLGAVLMWLFSILATFETYSKNRKTTKDLNKRIADLEEEKKSLLGALQHVAPPAGHGASDEHALSEANAPLEGVCQAEPCQSERAPSDGPDLEKKGTGPV
ncbi:MAG: LapA family protein [Synergistaceae bacterium]|jgi:uncharacterized integral membrane protein|nr:LapA family protein [Synergistaceae bacterium]